jgi:hypothetical protein
MSSFYKRFYFLLLLLSSNSYAYSLTDHKEITQAALRGIIACITPNKLSPETSQRVIEANLQEDLNFLGKWFRYSHFYHPEHDFKSARLNSRDRVLDLEKRLLTARSGPEREALLGKAIHHLQDMTAPPHVVPVNHFWVDGFESLQVSLKEDLAFQDCETLFNEASQKTLVDLHQELAEETWLLVKEGTLSAEQIRPAQLSPASLSLVLFWSPGSDQEWGSYGIFGNAFGAEWIKTKTHLYRVSPSSYASFKQSRLHSALRATQSALVRIFTLGL